MRIGGVGARERISGCAIEEQKMDGEVLCSYVRTAPRASPSGSVVPLTARAPDVQIAVTILGRWRERLGGPPPYLHLHDADLEGAYLDRAYLKGAELVGAKLQHAYLNDTELQDANLEGAQLQHANLERAQLQGANLEGAQLEDAKLQSLKASAAT